MSPPSFPPSVPCPGSSAHANFPFPPRDPSGRFPRFIGTTGRSDFLPSIACCRADCSLASLRFLRSALPPSAETTRSPRFLENPRVHAALCDPGGPPSQAIRAMPYSSARRCCLPPSLRLGLQHWFISGLDQRGLHARCLRFAARVALCRHARLATGVVAHLRRTGFQPAGFHREVSAMSVTCRPPHPSFAWRTEKEKRGSAEGSRLDLDL
jgi:hypothetical protein